MYLMLAEYRNICKDNKNNELNTNDGINNERNDTKIIGNTQWSIGHCGHANGPNIQRNCSPVRGVFVWYILDHRKWQLYHWKEEQNA